MGWCTGGTIAESVWEIVSPYLSEEAKPKVAQELIDLFEGYDCDVMMETSFWELAHEYCPVCNFEEDSVDNCKNCEGYGWVRKSIE